MNMSKSVGAVVVVAILVIGGYLIFADRNQTPAETQEAVNNNNPSDEPDQNNTTTVSSDWVKYESPDLKLSFVYPAMPMGTVKYDFKTFPKRVADPTGTIYRWDVKR